MGLRFDVRLRFIASTADLVIDFRILNPGPYGHMNTASAHVYFKRLAMTWPRLLGPVDLITPTTKSKKTRTASLMQVHSGSYEKGKPHESFHFQLWRDGKFSGDGARASGVMVMGSAKNSLGFGVERFWQNAPKVLSLHEDLTVIDFLPLGGKGPRHRGQYGMPGQGPLDPDSNEAYRFEGARAKRTRFIILNNQGSPARIMDHLVARVQHPIHAVPTMETLKSSRAFDRLLPRISDGSNANRRFERMMRIFVDDSAADAQPSLGSIGLPRFIERGGTYERQAFYGWFNFGDLAWGDGYSSLHYDWPLVMLMQYLRSGDMRFFETGRDMTLHRIDIDQDHDQLSSSRQRGGQFYEKGWWHGNYYHATPSHTWLGGPALFYLLTGDEHAKEAVQLGRDFVKRARPDLWSGDWGSRIPGWSADNLLTTWWLWGDPEDLKMVEDAILNFERIEQGRFGGKGFVINTKMKPASMQPWMHAIVFNAVARHAWLTKKKKFHPLMKRMLAFFKNEALTKSSAPYVYRHVNPLTNYRVEPSVHLCWPLAASFAWGALVQDDDDAKAMALRLFRHAATNHQNRPNSAIAFRMLQYPGSESKIYSNIGLWGTAARGALEALERSRSANSLK